MADDAGRPEFERLWALRRTGLLLSPALPDLDEICGRAKEHFRVAAALVTLIDEHQLVIMAASGTDLKVAPRAGQFCDVTIRSDDVFVVSDATHDERFASNPIVTGRPYLRFYAGAPLIHQRQIRLGALALLDTHVRVFSLGDKAELAQMADEVVNLFMEHEFDRKFGNASR